MVCRYTREFACEREIFRDINFYAMHVNIRVLLEEKIARNGKIRRRDCKVKISFTES